MSDRLNELRRQRALVQDHLTWLDREIAAESARSAAARPAPLEAATVAPPVPAQALGTPAANPAADPGQTAEADEILARFGYDPKSTQADVKRGCWIAFLSAFAAVGLVLMLWYLFRAT